MAYEGRVADVTLSDERRSFGPGTGMEVPSARTRSHWKIFSVREPATNALVLTEPINSLITRDSEIILKDLHPSLVHDKVRDLMNF